MLKSVDNGQVLLRNIKLSLFNHHAIGNKQEQINIMPMITIHVDVIVSIQTSGTQIFGLGLGTLMLAGSTSENCIFTNFDGT